MVMKCSLVLLPLLLAAALLIAQQPKPDTPPTPPENPPAQQPKEPEEEPVEWICPMDKDVRALGPGKCPRCGMPLVVGIPDPMEYPVRLRTEPRVLKPGANTLLALSIHDPKTDKIVTDLQLIHERKFHLFIVSQDLTHFMHEHPEADSEGVWKYETQFPKAGLYRILSDFYPTGGTPQMISSSLIVPGPDMKLEAPKLEPDLSPKKGENIEVSLEMEPKQPIAGLKTLMFFKITPHEGLEQYLAAWGHMMAGSWDLVDMIHNHPFLADGGPIVQFNMIFPRPGIYRVWVQFQRKGVVNTVAFNVPVSELK
jgi:hypothetical protein